MKERVLQNGRLLPALEANLAGRYDVHPLWREADPRAFLAAHGGEFAGYIASARLGIDAPMLAALPNLRVVSVVGVGLDAVDLGAARERGVAVGYTPQVLNDCVADTAMLLLLDVARRGSEADRFVRRGGWTETTAFPLSTSVTGKRLGIVGLGRIGRAIAKRCAGFDMQIRYHNRRPVADAPYGYEASLEELARWADFLVVSAAGGQQSRSLVSAPVLDALGPHGFLVNIARGSVVDEAALVAALSEGRLGGAGLDVYEDEPNVPPALLKLDNTVLLPHMSSATHETRKAMADLALANLDAFFASGTVKVSAL
ncbi:MAG TPA: 2-hydroxyacid dehydrogenase [Ramlibacter sp.]